MKIDVESINHNALRLIKDETAYALEDNSGNNALNECYFIAGILALADELKKVLEA